VHGTAYLSSGGDGTTRAQQDNESIVGKSLGEQLEDVLLTSA
jgi:hypothetical protein